MCFGYSFFDVVHSHRRHFRSNARTNHCVVLCVQCSMLIHLRGEFVWSDFANNIKIINRNCHVVSIQDAINFGLPPTISCAMAFPSQHASMRRRWIFNIHRTNHTRRMHSASVHLCMPRDINARRIRRVIVLLPIDLLFIRRSKFYAANTNH